MFNVCVVTAGVVIVWSDSLIRNCTVICRHHTLKRSSGFCLLRWMRAGTDCGGVGGLAASLSVIRAAQLYLCLKIVEIRTLYRLWQMHVQRERVRECFWQRERVDCIWCYCSEYCDPTGLVRGAISFKLVLEWCKIEVFAFVSFL